MTIRAPFKTLYGQEFKPQSYEREVFYETLGCCWALSVQNVSGEFPIRLLLDLASVELLYGCPTERLSDELVGTLVHVFQHRPKPWQHSQQVVHDTMMALLDGCTTHDFLNFNAGIQDGVRQVLEHCAFWSRDCHTAFLAVKFYANNLVECDLKSQRHRNNYAALVTALLLTGQKACLQSLNRNTALF